MINSNSLTDLSQKKKTIKEYLRKKLKNYGTADPLSEVDKQDSDEEISYEYYDTNMNVKLIHVQRKNASLVDLAGHLSDLHYSGN